ncbi:hypothetical protein EB232_02630 [Mesorhizobium sp. NZP2077]|nr:hypothetical protein EB232_02630 [Mesorhizobium sp. NZP2077]
MSICLGFEQLLTWRELCQAGFDAAVQHSVFPAREGLTKTRGGKPRPRAEFQATGQEDMEA